MSTTSWNVPNRCQCHYSMYMGNVRLPMSKGPTAQCVTHKHILFSQGEWRSLLATGNQWKDQMRAQKKDKAVLDGQRNVVNSRTKSRAMSQCRAIRKNADLVANMVNQTWARCLLNSIMFDNFTLTKHHFKTKIIMTSRTTIIKMKKSRTTKKKPDKTKSEKQNQIIVN